MANRLPDHRLGFPGQPLGRQLRGRFLIEAPGLLVSGQERLNFTTQGRIASAGFSQERRPLIRFTLQGAMKKLFDLLPAFRRHNYSRDSTSSSTFFRCRTPNIHISFFTIL